MMTGVKKFITAFALALFVVAASSAVLLVNQSKKQGALAASGPCTTPSPSYGTVQQSVNVPVSGTYKVWARMSAPERSKDTYLLDIDGTQCLTVGGSTVPVYSQGATTHFANNTTNWISRTPSGETTTLSLSAGTHTFKSLGSAPGVVLDRIILTQDSNCTPSGTGENCASPPDTIAPTITITNPASGATVSTTTNIVARATDASGVTKVEFYQNGTLRGSDTSADSNQSYSYSFNPSGLASGNYTFTARAYDSAGNVSTSSSVIVKIAGSTTTPPAALKGDVNSDGIVDIRDFSLLKGKFNQTGGSVGGADINGDGIVDIRDFSLLRSNFGKRA